MKDNESHGFCEAIAATKNSPYCNLINSVFLVSIFLCLSVAVVALCGLRYVAGQWLGLTAPWLQRCWRPKVSL